MPTQDKAKLTPYLSPFTAWAFAIGTSVGWGSLVVTANTYLSSAGPMGSVFGLLIGALVMLLMGYNYDYMMHCYPECGGAYAYAREVFGYDQGFLVSWFTALTYLAILWANATSLPLYARYFLGDIFRFGRLYTLFGYDVYLGEAILPILAVALIAFLCIRTKRAAGVLMRIMAIVFTLGITLAFIGSVTGLSAGLSLPYVPDTHALRQIIHIAIISPWAFIGFESISHGTEEFAFRRQRSFRLMFLVVLFTTLLYVFVLLLSVTAYPPQYDSWLAYIRDLDHLSGLEALPAFYAARAHMGNLGVILLMVSLLCLVLTSLIGNITALSRLFYALGKDQVLPSAFGKLSAHETPRNAIYLVALLSLPIPFVGRTAIGWIVDVTTIGATILYAIVSACAMKQAGKLGDRRQHTAGLAGLIIMVGFLVYLLVPNLVSEGSMAKETYFLFIIWSILGFLFFRSILHRDVSRRFGKSVIVWVALLTLVLFIALIWMRQSMIASSQEMLSHIQAHYSTVTDLTNARLEDERFIQEQMEKLQWANSRTMLMATAMFAFAMLIMMTNYSFMNKQKKESEMIANTDPLTGVKSKHAYLNMEKNTNRDIETGLIRDFAVVVCDVNGLKHINDTLGHKAGDEYIRSASSMICELFQHSPVFRIGGDEFVVILRGRDFDARDSLMQTLHDRSAAHIASGGAVVSGGLSAFDRENDHSLHDAFVRADQKMYLEKQALKQLGAKTRD